MKIPFTLDAWLKDKSQKVETRDGRLVHDIWRVKEPSFTNNRKTEVCALIDGEEDALVFFEGGRYLPTAKDTDSPFDLFIITPEPELTDFEKAVGSEIFDPPFNAEQVKVIKEESAKLLSLAREELQEKVIHDYWKQAADLCVQAREEGKAEALKEIEQDPESSYAFKRGVEYGKEEALKDLPRWRKCADCTPKPACSNEWIFSIDSENVTRESVIVHNGYFLPLGKLEKLPKEE